MFSEPKKEVYPLNIPAVASLRKLSFNPDVTFIIGENGTGKSTIIEAIALAMGFGPEGDTKNVQFATADTVSDLHKELNTKTPNIIRLTIRPPHGLFKRYSS